MTKQRQLIHDIVTEKPVHLTAEEIYRKARERMPGIAMGTVYRNLGILEQEGKIRKLDIPDSPARYDRQSLSHPHLICPRCGAVEDLDWGSEFLAELSGRCGRTLTGYDLKLYHICDVCGK